MSKASLELQREPACRACTGNHTRGSRDRGREQQGELCAPSFRKQLQVPLATQMLYLNLFAPDSCLKR